MSKLKVRPKSTFWEKFLLERRADSQWGSDMPCAACFSLSLRFMALRTCFLHSEIGHNNKARGWLWLGVYMSNWCFDYPRTRLTPFLSCVLISSFCHMRFDHFVLFFTAPQYREVLLHLLVFFGACVLTSPIASVTEYYIAQKNLCELVSPPSKRWATMCAVVSYRVWQRQSRLFVLMRTAYLTISCHAHNRSSSEGMRADSVRWDLKKLCKIMQQSEQELVIPLATISKLSPWTA